MKIYKHKGLYLQKSPVHGYGVYTDVKILKGELVEECPVGDILPLDFSKYKLTFLMPYPSLKNKESLWHPTGYCAYFNHSNSHNVVWEIDTSKNLAYFTAVNNIIPGEELFINYNLEM
jgi:hypothetical protein